MLATINAAWAELDCDYFDTVDLSGIQPDSNGSYLYENLLIPGEFTGKYDYELTGDGDERIQVAEHIRGCACKLKSCVRFCCHHNLLLINSECQGNVNEILEYDPKLNITMEDGSVAEKHVLSEFVVQRHLPLPCQETGTYYLDDHDEDYKWSLFENGTFLRKYDGVLFKKSQYCLQPSELNKEIRLVPHNCQIASSLNLQAKIAIPISLLSFLITIGVYLYLPKLRNLHGKCFACYLGSLFVGYLMLLLDTYKALVSYFYLCLIAGYVGYFSILAAFFWLNVMSLDLWNSFRGTNDNRYRAGNRFLVYNLYAWGGPLLFTILISILDQVLSSDNTDLNWIPGVFYSGCWIKTFDWSAMVYFYGPMLILIIFNTTLFILTAFEIIKVKKELRNIVKHHERKQKLNSDKQRYSFFLRLFLLMGVSWSFEIVSYLVQHYDVWSYIFLIADIFHYSQGGIILLLFVLKRNVYESCRNRIQGKEKSSSVLSQSNRALLKNKSSTHKETSV
ncbi:G-protein coupled receptor Mth [Drosophila willistoni]|uniref:G-protein coupled receptor Mth n=1 Tax=Drosophila willistoni TaxID=7260 RepID=UPI001F084C49|nr:G-protein coupled receptor Mth [Drosophila willistoni]